MLSKESLIRYRAFVTQARDEHPTADTLIMLAMIEQLLEHIEDLTQERYRGFQIGDGNTQQNTF